MKEKLMKSFRAFTVKKAKGADEERGVALIFTLGILALLLIMALAFATNSITERKAAANNNDYTVARMLAKSGINRAVGAMRFYSTLSDYFDNFFSHDGTGDCIATGDTSKLGKYDFLYRLATQFEGTRYDWPSNYDVDSQMAVNWQYVKDGSADNKIIGRYAYIVLPNGGRIDPSAAVDSGAVTPLNQAALALTESSTDKKRPGVEVAELHLANLNNAYISAHLQDLSADNASPSTGMLPAGTRQPTDWDTFFNSSFNAPLLTASDFEARKGVQDLLDITKGPAEADEESFWVDSDGDTIVDANEKFDRFNLWQDWSLASVGTITGARRTYDGTDTNGGGIDWIRNFAKTSAGADDASYKGTFANVSDRRNQIAANIIDYCKSTIGATHAPSDDSPTYVGLEYCPYINEARVQFQSAITEAASGTAGVSNYTASLVITGIVELINMYNMGGATLTPSATVIIQYAYDTDIPGMPTYASAADETFSIAFSIGDYTANAAYQAGNVTIKSVSSTFSAAANTTYSITNARIISMKVKLLGSGSEYYDFSYFEPQTGGAPSLATLQSGNGTGNWYVDYEVNDPRQNLNYDDWTRTSGIASNGTVSTSGTTGKNSICNPNPGTGYDTEETASGVSAVEPWQVSSAYIRKGPMRSPWELGIIHRASKWQTLNLKCYDKSDGKDGLSGNAGGRAYTESATGAADGGDANIFDQIKFGIKATNYGKVNLRNSGDDVMRTLLMGIYLPAGIWTKNTCDAKAAFDDPGVQTGSVNYIESTRADEIAGKIKAFTGTNILKTRAQIAGVASLSNGTITGVTQNTDAKKEAIISKFVNLTKVGSSDTFTIIAIGQAIRDVGTPTTASGGITIKKDLDNNGTIGTATETTTTSSSLAFGDISGIYPAPTITETISDCRIGKYDKYADEILSEQKIIATVYKDSTTGTWRIVRLDYLGD